MKSVAFFGGSNIGKGPWRPGKKVWSIVFIGSSEIDFCQAQLEEPVTKVRGISFFGSTKVIVSEEMPVTLSGFSIFGSRNVKRPKGSEAPVESSKGLHINFVSMFGSLAVRVPER